METEKCCINEVGLVGIYTCSSNTGSIRDDPYWTSRKNSRELIEPSSVNKVSSIYSSCCYNGSI